MPLTFSKEVPVTYPIVLAHGVCRFDILWNETLDVDNNDDPRIDRLNYFRGIRTMLKDKGHIVYHSKVGWAADIEKRAADLKENILKILRQAGSEKVNIIAHSMGGLDSRHMLFNDCMGGKIHERIASLTTISTPHNGSPFADWGLDNLSRIPALLKRIGLDVSAFEDLRTDICKAFNDRSEVKEFEKQCQSRIIFQTYAGKQDFWGVFNLLKGPFRIVEEKEGENDGLVSVQSAKWREEYFMGVLDETDHLNELGWWEISQLVEGESSEQLLRRIHEFYARIAEKLP
jgi:triacylglycerol lipase